MSDFRFLHAADIHLDSPLHGLSRYEGVPHAEVRGATRAAFDRLIDAALEQAVDFVLIAGDLYDGDWKDMGTGLYFAGAMGRLAHAAIPVFLLAGNHDAASVITKSLPLPETVKLFGHRKAESFTLDDLGVALHGRSFPTAHVTEDLAQGYPPPRPGVFNIGVLHTALGGHPQHAPYAPCSIPQLVATGYDYWALGHVHDHAVLHETPHIVFPGNLQGRHIRETGPKGAVLVEVTDRAVRSVEHLPLDVVRWARVVVDCGGTADLDAVHARTRDALADAMVHEADGRPLVARVVLEGPTALHGALTDGVGALRDAVRALAAQVSGELWVEKIAVRTSDLKASAAATAVSDEFTALLDEAAGNLELAAALADEFAAFLSVTPAPLAGADEDLATAAREARWTPLLDAGGAALRARLLQGAG